MDVNLLRTIITVLAFAAFLGIAYWAYTSRNRKRFDEAANLPFADEEMAERSTLDKPQQTGKNSNG